MPDRSVLETRLAALFSTALHIDLPSVDTDLFDTGVLDSLAFVDLLFHLEQEFGVTAAVDDLELENFRSIARIAEFLVARMEPEPALPLAAGTPVAQACPAVG